MTLQFVANVNVILGEVLYTIGTIEGRLEAFNVHGTVRYFAVYDDLTDTRIRCEIFYRNSGDIERIKASSLDVFPDEEDLPTA